MREVAARVAPAGDMNLEVRGDDAGGGRGRAPLYRLSVAPYPFLVVLDRQGRPRGVVCGLDVVVAESADGRPVQGVATDDTRAG